MSKGILIIIAYINDMYFSHRYAYCEFLSGFYC